MSEAKLPVIVPESIPFQVDGFELTKTPCCYYIKDEKTKSFVKLNDSSALIWQVCTGEWAVGEIVDVLKESYPDSAESMEDDVYQALGLLLNEGAIEFRSEAI